MRVRLGYILYTSTMIFKDVILTYEFIYIFTETFFILSPVVPC